ncbi:MAG: type VI secretion system contractile sheath large subunit [Myxococcales bacterium]|nr:type VI secretion system contractile sheath large subunit [Myxococcales bacterium]
MVNASVSSDRIDLAAIAARGTSRTILDEIMATCTVLSGTPEREQVTAGLRELLRFAVSSGQSGAHADIALVDLVIVAVTERLSRQIDAVLHHPAFQALEAAWRGLRFVIDRVDFSENISVELLNLRKADLIEDFQDAPELVKCGLYRLVYSNEFGVFGGRPYGLLVANYEFSPTPQDMFLLDQCAAVATMSHAPFIAAAAPPFFGMKDYASLPQLNDLHSLFEGPQYVKWRAFRDSDDSRSVGLTLPRFLLRLPYGAESMRVKAFDYEEDVLGEHEHFLWGNAAFAFATRIANSFAHYRWCLNIVGPETGGTVEDLPLHRYRAMGQLQTKIPTEIIVTERREAELADLGFIAFAFRRETENACFFSASSTQKPKYFGIGADAQKAALNHRLGTQLPYLFITCRLAHYIKVLQRENIGSWKERDDLQTGLQTWINQYVAAMTVVSAAVRARRPLKSASVIVAAVAGSAGWYKVDLQVQPHFHYMGAEFQIGLVGRLDQE